jgi:hypothetical protein
VESVLLIFLVVYVVICVFTFLVPCCDVPYDFRIKTKFCSSLPPVVRRMAHVLFVLYVFTYVVLCCVFVMFFFVLSFCVPDVASFSGLSIFDCLFGIL